MWWLTVAVASAAYVMLAWKAGPARGLAVIVPVAMALPAWCMLPLLPAPPGSIVGSGVDVKVAVGSVALGLYCFLPGRTFPTRLLPCDLIAVGLILIHVCSDVLNSGFSWLIPARAYVEWYLPYMLGRLAVQRVEELPWLAYTLAGVAIALGLVSIIESLSGLNLFEVLYGVRPLEGTSRDLLRWGFRRAYGPALHPIYFGGQLLFCLAGCVYLAWWAAQRRCHAGWLFAPLIPIAGIWFTGSRGPLLALLAVIFGLVFGRWQKSRVSLLALMVVMAGASWGFREPLLGWLENWTGEAGPRQVVIDDQTRSFSGTRSRLLIFEVYSIALRRSGWLGFGTEAVTGFPINVPVGPREAETLDKVRFIDNSYILLMLRFGWLGMGLFTLASLVAVTQLWWVSTRSVSSRCRLWATAHAGSLCGLAALILTVWLPHELGFPLVWSWGASSGLLLTSRQLQTGSSGRSH